MKKIVSDIPTEILIKAYLELGSSYRVSEKYEVSATAVKRILKDARVLRTQSAAAKIRTPANGFKRSEESKILMSKLASERVEEKNPFFGRKHTEESKAKIGMKSKERTGKRNSNYKHGKTVRRPRNFQISKFMPIRNFVFNRDGYTCAYTGQKGGSLHAHHILPYWVCPQAFLDPDNLVTVSTKAHFSQAHKGNWHRFDVSLVTDTLLKRYSLDRERLSEIASFSHNEEATVRTSAIYKTEE